VCQPEFRYTLLIPRAFLGKQVDKLAITPNILFRSIFFLIAAAAHQGRVKRLRRISSQLINYNYLLEPISIPD
jgi:hypothetical protein